MLSRVAERVYWMARYLERVENTARIITVYSNLLLDLTRNLSIGWKSLVEVTDSVDLFQEHYKEELERNIVKFVLTDTRNPGSLVNSLGFARQNARAVRNVLPNEAWELLNELYLKSTTELPAALSRRKRYEYLMFLIGGIQQLTGLLSDTMTHNVGYQFVCIGRYLERVDMTSRILDTIAVESVKEDYQESNIARDHVLCMNVLKSLSAYHSFRQEVRGAINRGNVLEFVFQNKDFPRAILHCLYEIQISNHQLPRHLILVRSLNRIIKVVEKSNIDTSNSANLHAVMENVQHSVAKFQEHFSENYFLLNKTSLKRKASKIIKNVTNTKLNFQSTCSSSQNEVTLYR